MIGWVIGIVGVIGFAGLAYGLINLIRPLPRLGIPDRGWAAAIMALSAIVAVVASILMPTDFVWPWNR